MDFHTKTHLTVFGESAVVCEGDDHVEHGHAVGEPIETAEVLANVTQQLGHHTATRAHCTIIVSSLVGL